MSKAKTPSKKPPAVKKTPVTAKPAKKSPATAMAMKKNPATAKPAKPAKTPAPKTTKGSSGNKQPQVNNETVKSNPTSSLSNNNNNNIILSFETLKANKQRELELLYPPTRYINMQAFADFLNLIKLQHLERYIIEQQYDGYYKKLLGLFKQRLSQIEEKRKREEVTDSEDSKSEDSKSEDSEIEDSEIEDNARLALIREYDRTSIGVFNDIDFGSELTSFMPDLLQRLRKDCSKEDIRIEMEHFELEHKANESGTAAASSNRVTFDDVPLIANNNTKGDEVAPPPSPLPSSTKRSAANSSTAIVASSKSNAANKSEKVGAARSRELAQHTDQQQQTGNIPVQEGPPEPPNTANNKPKPKAGKKTATKQATLEDVGITAKSLVNKNTYNNNKNNNSKIDPMVNTSHSFFENTNELQSIFVLPHLPDFRCFDPQWSATVLTKDDVGAVEMYNQQLLATTKINNNEYPSAIQSLFNWCKSFHDKNPDPSAASDRYRRFRLEYLVTWSYTQTNTNDDVCDDPDEQDDGEASAKPGDATTTITSTTPTITEKKNSIFTFNERESKNNVPNSSTEKVRHLFNICVDAADMETKLRTLFTNNNNNRNTRNPTMLGLHVCAVSARYKDNDDTISDDAVPQTTTTGITVNCKSFARLWDQVLPVYVPLVFDIDADAYDVALNRAGMSSSKSINKRCRSRFCCGTKKVCFQCWRIIVVGCKIVKHAILQFEGDHGSINLSGKNQNEIDLFYTFSGRRGAHIFVRDLWCPYLRSSTLSNDRFERLLRSVMCDDLMEDLLRNPAAAAATTSVPRMGDEFWNMVNTEFEHIYCSDTTSKNCMFTNPDVAAVILQLMCAAITQLSKNGCSIQYAPPAVGLSANEIVFFHFPSLFKPQTITANSSNLQIPPDEPKYLVSKEVYYYGNPNVQVTNNSSIKPCESVEPRRCFLIGPAAHCRNRIVRRFIMLNMLAPRIDIQATKLDHTVRLPWAVHAGTGFINVPLTLDQLSEIDPSCPTVGGIEYHVKNRAVTADKIRQQNEKTLLALDETIFGTYVHKNKLYSVQEDWQP